MSVCACACICVCARVLALHIGPLQYVCVCVGASVNIFLSLDDSNWLHLKAIAFLGMHSVGQDPRAIYYIKLKYVQSAD